MKSVSSTLRLGGVRRGAELRSEKIFALLPNHQEAAGCSDEKLSTIEHGLWLSSSSCTHRRADLLLPNVPAKDHINCATVADRGWLGEPVVLGSLWMRKRR
jgi:hypothetical protein